MGDSSIAVSEMLNGCLCCVLVGQMENALIEMREKYRPSQIIVEASGSAFPGMSFFSFPFSDSLPAAIAWQIRQLPGFGLDAIVTVIDCVNFDGYADRSPTAKMQAQYTDLILLNKHELVDERRLDLVIDRINDLNTDTPRIFTEGPAGVSPDVLLGLNARVTADADTSSALPTSQLDAAHQQREVDLLHVDCDVADSVTAESLNALFAALPRDQFFRIKGFLRDADGDAGTAFNYAFGRAGGARLESVPAGKRLRLVFMGDGLRPFVKKIAEAVGCAEKDIVFSPKHEHHH